MSLPRTAVERPVTTLMIYAGLMLFGFFALFQLPVDLMPNAQAGNITVYIGIRGGLPPEDIETLVTKVVEESVATVQHLRSVLSVSRKDRATVTLTYEPGTDLSFAALEVQERIAKIKNKLPKDIEKPVVAHYSENDYPVVILALTSDRYSPEKLREVVDNVIKPQMTRITGVANVEVGGGRERKILVEFDQTRLEAYQLSIRQVTNTIGTNNVNLLTGKREEGSSSFYVRTMGQFQTIDDLKKLPVAHTREGSTIRLEDIAEVRDFFLEAQSYARLNKKPTVSIYVQKENNANTIRVAERVITLVNKIKKKSLGPDIALQVVSDQSIFIRDAVQNVTGNLTWGSLMTWLVIFFFLKEWKHTTLIFMSVPVAVLVTLALMFAAHISLNVMTLSALALGIGIVVDSATVVLEEILERKRHALKKGEAFSNREVCVKAAEDLYVPLVGSTLTTVVVFLPIIFINQQVRILYSGLAFTITFSITASLFVAVTLIPLLATQIPLPGYAYFSPETREKFRFWRAEAAARTPDFAKRIGRWISRRGAAFFPAAAPAEAAAGGTEAGPEEGRRPGMWEGLSRKWYGEIWPGVLSQWRALRAHPRRTYIHWCALSLRHQKYIGAAVAAATALSLGIYFFALDKDFMGSAEQNEFVIFIELPAGAKLDISDQVVSEVEKMLSDTPEISKTVKTAAARVEGWSSKIYVTLNSREERSRSIQEIISDLRPKVADIGSQYDAFIYFSEPESSKEFIIDVFGQDYDKIKDLAASISTRLKVVRGLNDIKLRYKEGRPEFQFVIDKEKAALFGLTVKDIAEELHALIRGIRPTYFYTETEEIEIITRDQEKFRKTIEDLQYLNVIGPEGNAISVQQFADFHYTVTPSEVWRKDKQRVIQVSANREKLALSAAASRALSALKGMNVPQGYYFQIGGDYVDMVENERQFRYAFFVMVGLVFIVLASLFESYSNAILVMVTIPMALIGSIPLLYVTNTAATMSVYIGMIMLGGMVLSAAIILVEKINQSRDAGMSLERAVLDASWTRLSPILNTSLTTIVDLIPMALSRSESAQLWAPLALTMIGGATMSTFLTLFMIPALYYHMEILKTRYNEKFAAQPEIAPEQPAQIF